MRAYAVSYIDPDVPGHSTFYVTATCPEQAEINANVLYYGETVPTITPKHEVRIVLL
jgi:hypothetical protein